MHPGLFRVPGGGCAICRARLVLQWTYMRCSIMTVINGDEQVK